MAMSFRSRRHRRGRRSRRDKTDDLAGWPATNQVLQTFSCPPFLLLSLIERLAQRDIALLLLGPVAAAGNGAIDDEIVAVDEGRLVAGQEYRGVRDILRQTGARDRLPGLVD